MGNLSGFSVERGFLWRGVSEETLVQGLAVMSHMDTPSCDSRENTLPLSTSQDNDFKPQTIV